MEKTTYLKELQMEGVGSKRTLLQLEFYLKGINGKLSRSGRRWWDHSLHLGKVWRLIGGEKQEEEWGKWTLAFCWTHSPLTHMRRRGEKELTLYREWVWVPLLTKLIELKTWVSGPQAGSTNNRKALLIKSSFRKIHILWGLETLEFMSRFCVKGPFCPWSLKDWVLGSQTRTEWTRKL